MVDSRPFAAVPIVVHTACDSEAYAAAWNDGYEAAVTHGLADDPALADDWFQAKLREAQAKALVEAADGLARLEYVRPDTKGREEYERLLAIRRGNTDAWLRARADDLKAAGT